MRSKAYFNEEKLLVSLWIEPSEQDRILKILRANKISIEELS